MRKSFTAVIEKNTVFTESFATEPYEAGWAGEARWFVRVVELSGRLTLAPQISPDGLFWCDEGSPALEFGAPGMQSIALSGFGQWLRLNAALAGEGARAKALISLALKE